MRICPPLALIASSQFGLAGPLDCSVYALRRPDGMVMIDSGAGTNTAVLLANLREELGDAPLRAVVLTHCHPDHAAGAALLQKETGCRVLAPGLSAAAVESADEEATGLAVGARGRCLSAGFPAQTLPCGSVLSRRRMLRSGGHTVSGHTCARPQSGRLLPADASGARQLAVQRRRDLLWRHSGRHQRGRLR